MRRRVQTVCGDLSALALNASGTRLGVPLPEDFYCNVLQVGVTKETSPWTILRSSPSALTPIVVDYRMAANNIHRPR